MIVDTHVHVVAADQQRYPLQPSSERSQGFVTAGWFREGPVTVEEQLRYMEGAGVDRVVLVQPFTVYGYGNSYAVDSAARYPGRCASVGIIDMLAAGAADTLSYWVRERGMGGLRIVMSAAGCTCLDDPRIYPIWERAAALGIPVCVSLLPRHIPEIQRLLQRFPTVPVALDHFAHTFIGSGPPDEAAGDLLGLAQYPNLYLKFSTMNFGTAEKPATAPEFFKQVVYHFGARRVMWASNFMNTRGATYKEMLDIGCQAVSFLPEDDQEWLMGGTALSLWPGLGGS